MINDKEFKSRLREAVLDFLKKESRVPTQKELKAIYGIKPHSMDYFRTSRGYKTMNELFEECVGFEIPSMYDVPFDEKLREVLLMHMQKFGCLPFLTEIKSLYYLSEGYLCIKARKNRLSTQNYLWSLVKDDIKGTPLEKCFVRPEPQKREYDPELIKKRLQEGYGVSNVVKELKTGVSSL